MGDTHAGKTAACPARSRLGVCSLSNDQCLVFAGALGLPMQGGTLAKGMAMELGLSYVAFSSASESPQLSHLSPFLA